MHGAEDAPISKGRGRLSRRGHEHMIGHMFEQVEGSHGLQHRKLYLLLLPLSRPLARHECRHDRGIQVDAA